MLGSVHSRSTIAYVVVVVFVIVLITLVDLDAPIVISNTIIVMIAAVVGIVVSVRVTVGAVNLNNRLKLGCTSLIDVGYCYDVIVRHTPLIDVCYCYDVIVVVVLFDFIIVDVDDCRAIHTCDNAERGKVSILCDSIIHVALGDDLVLNGQGVTV